MTADIDLVSKQFAIVVDMPAHNGYRATVDYVDAKNPRLIGHTSVINPPPPHYTYSMLELRQAMKLLRENYPEAHIEAHEVAYIDHRAMIERWSAMRAKWQTRSSGCRRAIS